MSWRGSGDFRPSGGGSRGRGNQGSSNQGSIFGDFGDIFGAGSSDGPSLPILIGVALVLGCILLVGMIAAQAGRGTVTTATQPAAAPTAAPAAAVATTAPAAAATTAPAAAAATTAPAAAAIPTAPYGPALATGTGTALSLSPDGDLLAFSPSELTVKNGIVTLTFNNTASAVQHNFVLVEGGVDVADAVDKAAQAQVTRLTGAAGAAAPADTPGLLVATQLINAGDSVTVTFETPGTGTYTFLCTFPGHYLAGMTGTLTVN